MSSRLLTVVSVAAGAVLIGAGSAFAFVDDPHAMDPHAMDPHAMVVADMPGGTVVRGDEALATARDNLQQASLPLTILDGGVGQLADGSRQLDDGAQQLAGGLAQAHVGGTQLADGLGQLEGGVAQLGDGAAQVSTGVDEVVERLAGFGAMQGVVTEQLTGIADGLVLAGGPVSQGAAAELRTLVDTLNTQGLGPDTLGRLGQLQDGARQLEYELTAPEAEFVAGMTQAADGSRQLRDGLLQLDGGGRQLADGTGQLVGGVAPVTGIVKGIADNVREATGALPAQPASSPSTARAATPEADAAARQWWPYALIATGAVVLALNGLRPARRRAVTG